MPIEAVSFGLNAKELGVFTYFCSCSESYHPSVSYIAKRLNITKPTVKTIIQKLIKFNIIKLITKHEKNVTTRYQLVNPKRWIRHPQEGNVVAFPRKDSIESY